MSNKRQPDTRRTRNTRDSTDFKPKGAAVSNEAEAIEVDWDEHFEGLDEIDIASALSFPASDPPALSPPPRESPSAGD